MKYSVSIKEIRDLKREGLTNAEIAEQVGCSEELVKKKLARKKSAVKTANKDLDAVRTVPIDPEVGSAVESEEPEVKRNWMGFKKKDQS